MRRIDPLGLFFFAANVIGVVFAVYTHDMALFTLSSSVSVWLGKILWDQARGRGI